ncbi:Plasma membrane permease, mediates uptake of glycerophosphoinositol and glycerophosphocholine, partial [Tilletia horrida]
GKDIDTPLDPRQARLRKHSDIFTVLASGCALISDGYQNNLMTMTNVLFTKRYGKAVYNSEVSTRVSNALLVGAVLGQVIVGLVCDRIGRKSAIVLTTALLVVSAIFATAASPIGGSTSALFWWLTVARGGVGVGVGGEYPASSTSASEAANEKYGRKKRGTVFVFVTNVVLSLGGPFAISVFLIVLSASQYANTSSPSDERRLDIVWRICFGIGALLPLIVFYFRWKILNSKLYRRGAIRKNVPYWLAVKRYWPRLVGTCLVWFIYDFVVFPNGISSGTIIASVVKDSTLKSTAEYQLLLSAIALPGAFLGAFALPYFGSKYLLMTGFTGFIIIGLSIGLAWEKVTANVPAFVVLYGLLASFGNFGPGSVCGLVAAESYPTALRGTFYGLSAAIGKTGAAIGTQVFRPIQDNLGKKWTFIIAAIVGLVGVVIAYIFVPDTTQLDFEAEDEAWRAYLLSQGWNHEMGDGSGPEHLASEVVVVPRAGAGDLRGTGTAREEDEEEKQQQQLH